MNIFHLGLIGYPLGHSLSPRIHKAALKACGLSGEYFLFPVQPEDHQGLKNLLARVRCGEISGLNVTIPHKQNVIPVLDELTPTAKASGAVNTIFMQSGKLIGDNTDAPGFLADLKRFIGHWDGESGNWEMGNDETKFQIVNRQPPIVNGKSALVLGAGGSASGIVYALVNEGWNITIMARRIAQAQGLSRQYMYNVSVTELRDLSSFTFPISPFLLINATPLGMSPHIDASPWPAGLPFPANAVVYDLVYNPRETKLVKAARAAGLRATSGLGMLIEQAALAFEIWTGSTPPRDVLWAAVQ